MAIVVEPMGVRERPSEQLERLFAGGWPAFFSADVRAGSLLPRVREQFGDLELALTEDGQLVAAGWAVPVVWDGTVDGLPQGYTDSLAKALDVLAHGAVPDTLVICAAQVRRDLHGRGLAERLLTALIELGERRGCGGALAPVRPTLKSSYPLTPIDRYAAWIRDDGSPFDPWLRTHWRMGARVLATAPASQTMTGTVADWEGWTSLAFPESGDYVIPGGLSTLSIDCEADSGTYVEPNIWVRHR